MVSIGRIWRGAKSLYRGARTAVGLFKKGRKAYRKYKGRKQKRTKINYMGLDTAVIPISTMINKTRIAAASASTS